MQVDAVRRFVEALKETIDTCGRRVCVIAGVDLAHLGPKFGHEYSVDRARLRQAEQDDAKLLDRVAALDAKGFYQEIARDHDGRNICGASAIYVLLQVAGAERGELLGYGQAPEPETRSMVSFASMALTRSAK